MVAGPNSTLISLVVNGQPQQLAVDPHETLLDALRDRLDLVGSKQGCDKGDCGACTMQLDGVPVLSCITLAVQAQGRRVTTVEGLATAGVHPLQLAFADHNAAQCGFCTPGILMAAEHLVRSTARPVTRAEVSDALSGNLCRCTGYERILVAVVEASEKMHDASDEHHGEGT